MLAWNSNLIVKLMFCVVLEGKKHVNICPCTVFKYVEYREGEIYRKGIITIKHILIDCLVSKPIMFHHVSW